MKVFSK